jgi:Flp pilus assembly protein TadD
LAATGQGKEATAQFGEAVRLRPDNADARRSLGMALLTQGRMDEGIAQFNALVRLTPNDARIHYDLGTMLVSVGRLDEAIAQFSEALRLRPDFAAARQRLEAASLRRDQQRDGSTRP